MSSSTRTKAAISIALALAIALTVIGGLSFVRKVGTFRSAGLSFAQGGAQRLAIEAVDSALHPELRVGDQILLVNGDDHAGAVSLQRALLESETSELLVQRGEDLLEVGYVRPPLDIDTLYLVQALIGAIYLLIGLYTVLRQQGRQTWLFYLWAVVSASVYLLVSTPLSQLTLDTIGKSIYVIEDAARWLLAPLTLHFFLTFSHQLANKPTFRRLIPFLYLPTAVAATLQADLIFNSGRLLLGAPGAAALGTAIALLERIGLLLIVSFAIAAAGFLLYQSAREVERDRREEQRQLLWLALGTGFGYAPFVVLYFIPLLLGLEGSVLLRMIAVLPLALVPVTFAYAILRYRLWDITIIARDVATYTLTALFGVLGFSTARLFLERGLPDNADTSLTVLTVLTAVLIGSLLIPARQKIGESLERVYYRGGFGKRRTLANLGRKLLEERDLESLAQLLLEQLDEGLMLERTNLFLSEGDELRPVRSEPIHRDEGPVYPVPLDSFSDGFWDSDFEILSGIALPDAAASAVQRLFVAGYRYAFPLKVRDRRVGILVSSFHMGDTPLSSEDQDLMRQLLNQAGLAIENAHLLDRLHNQLRQMQDLKLYNEGIINASPAGIAVIDRQNCIVSANLAFAEIVKSDELRIRSRPLAEFLPIDDLPSPEEGLVELTVADGDEERHLQLDVADYSSGSSGELRVLIVSDVSERVNMERDLEDKERLASLGAIAAGIAHEVNTPLTGISSYAQMLLDKTEPHDPRHALLKKIERQTFRASAIVNSLLSLARTRSHTPQPIALKTLIDEVTELMSDSLESNGVALEMRIDDPLVVLARESELQQVFTNLCSNAIDAMAGRGGVLRLLSRTNGDRQVEVVVEDTGPGVPAALREKIFEPFFSTKHEQGGTGLGLSISAEILRRNGGELRVEEVSQGEGARFLVRLPAADQAS